MSLLSAFRSSALRAPFQQRNFCIGRLPKGVQHSVLPNGIRVFTRKTHDIASTVGIFLDGGVRSEWDGSTSIPNGPSAFHSMHGASQFFSRMIPHTGSDLMSGKDRVDSIINSGIYSDFSYTRENLMSFMIIPPGILEKGVDLVVSSMINPRFEKSVLDEQKIALQHEMSENLANPEIWGSDALSATIYGDSPMGLSEKILEQNEIDSMTIDKLAQYHRETFVGNRMVVVATGSEIEHDRILELVGRSLATLPSGSRLSHIKPQFISGREQKHSFPDVTKMDEYTLSRYSQHVTGSFFWIAFPAPAIKDPDFIATAVLSQMMGGGASFSVGGPGKGMYTRLNTNVIYEHHYVQSAQSFHLGFRDTGSFIVSCKADYDKLPSVVNAIVAELADMKNITRDEEVQRAKRLFKSNVLMALESRIVWCDDIGRGALLYDDIVSSEGMMHQVDAITREDLIRAASRILASTPSTFSYAPGHLLPQIPSINHIQDVLQGKKKFFNKYFGR
eukprot:TRINITY_DN10912_c0_g1_i1.p1 TRINITY_DN10912_c0_g1~~TRINITY_DN10912_c0_g1_i1.p1  ORF type:complete len:504 (+),score=179.17 TRINITY_DN10912_c0_g1_i1:3-1514(+)